MQSSYRFWCANWNCNLAKFSVQYALNCIIPKVATKISGNSASWWEFQCEFSWKICSCAIHILYLYTCIGELGTWTRFTKGLWAHNWNLESSLSYDFDSFNPISSQFCTCHDSLAVVACAKLRPDWFIIFHVRDWYIFLCYFNFELINCW